ncbi:hypothetical protein IFVP408_C1210337 [Vibrio parahaemolyticus]
MAYNTAVASKNILIFIISTLYIKGWISSLFSYLTLIVRSI